MWTWGPSGADPVSFDPFRSFVISLLLAEVSNGATVFPDEITGGNATRATNGPTGTTAQSPFGAASADFPNTTIGTTSLLALPTADWIGSGSGDTTLYDEPWCIDAWIRPTSIATRVQCICGDDFTSGALQWNGYLIVGTTGILQFAVRSGAGSTTVTSSAGAIVQGVWQHVAVTGDGSGGYTLWVDGEQVATGSGSSYTKQNNGSWLWGEQNRQVGPFERNWIGQMKCMRITWGNQRYTGAFTPPQSLQDYEAA